jgi:hypothetical protein
MGAEFTGLAHDGLGHCLTTPEIINKLVIMYEKRIAALSRAIRSASFSFLPVLGPRAEAHILQALSLFFMNPSF